MDATLCVVCLSFVTSLQLPLPWLTDSPSQRHATRDFVCEAMYVVFHSNFELLCRAQQHGTNETRNTFRNKSNTNLMQGHRDSSVSSCSLPEITEHRIFVHFILLRANQLKRYYILYITIMFKHLKVIFLHFGLKNRNRLSEYEFYSWAVEPILYPKNSDQNFKFTSIFFYNFQPLAQHSNYDF